MIRSLQKHKFFLSFSALMFSALLFLLVMNFSGWAQSSRSQPAASQASASQPAAPSAQQPTAQQTAPVETAFDPVRAIMMVRSTLIALQQANETGNYSLLRELGSVEFQASNSTMKLHESFAALRSRGIDLTPVTVLEPKWLQAPKVENNLVQLKGFFPSSPLQVNFDASYAFQNNRFRLNTFSIDLVPATATTSSVPAKGK